MSSHNITGFRSEFSYKKFIAIKIKLLRNLISRSLFSFEQQQQQQAIATPLPSSNKRKIVFH